MAELKQDREGQRLGIQEDHRRKREQPLRAHAKGKVLMKKNTRDLPGDYGRNHHYVRALLVDNGDFGAYWDSKLISKRSSHSVDVLKSEESVYV